MEELLRKIDRYIEESLDENFDRYLEQMKRILTEHPEQMEDVARSVEENMERYRINQAHLREELERRAAEEEAAEPEGEALPEEKAPEEGEAFLEEVSPEEKAPEEEVSPEEKILPEEEAEAPSEEKSEGPEEATIAENVIPPTESGTPVRNMAAPPNSQGSSTEFKIGIGVLSAIGVLFVLVGLMILVRNFLPDVVQGMMMLSFFALVWILSQLCLSRVAQKLALGCTAAGIAGTYLAVVLNYYVFESFPEWLTCGLLILTGFIAWAAGRTSRSAVIQCTGTVGFLFFWLFLPWGDGIPAYAVMLAVTIILNILWQFMASGKYIYVVQMTHQISFIVSALIAAVILSARDIPGGPVPVFIFSVLTAILVNLFYLNKKDIGFFIVWLCSMAFISAYLCGVWLTNLFLGNPWWNCLIVALAAANVVFLFVRKFRWKYQVYYYQAAAALFLLSCSSDVWWVGLAATVILFLIGLWKIREHPLVQEMVMLALLSLEILSIPTSYVFLISLLLMVLAILAVIAGFVRREMPLRIYGLCLSLFACGKVVFYDFWDLELLQKSLLFLGVGVIAIAIAMIYAVLEQRQKKNEKAKDPAAGSGLSD